MASEDMEPPSKAPRLTDNNDSDAEESSYNFSSPWHFSDVVLVVEGRKFHVHKSTLSMLSPVFEKMFSSGFCEKNWKEISLPGKNADEFEVLLKMIYSFKTDQKVTVENLEFLLKLADEYQIERVKDLCVDHLCDRFHLYDSFGLCRIAYQYSLGDLITTDSINMASKMNMESIESSPCYSDFSDGLKLQILTKRIKHLEILLKQYFLTCSSLVDKAYSAISKKVTCNCKCERHKLHDIEEVGGVTQDKYFDSKCIRCIERLERNWPEKDALTKYLKGPLKKLMSYNMLDYEDLNL